MKKSLQSLRRVIMMVILCAFTGYVWGYTAFESGGVYYIIYPEGSSEVAVISGASPYSGSVTIPSSVVYEGKTYAVTSIGGEAFSMCAALTEVNIPNSVTIIGEMAFERCTGLSGVILPGSLTDIESRAFSDCRGLTELILPPSLRVIGDNALNGCSSLSVIDLPSSVITIGRNAFDGTGWYDSQPDGLVYINNMLYKYKGRRSPSSVVIAEGTMAILSSAFEGSRTLESVDIPNTVKSIGSYAFYNCNLLEEAVLPDLLEVVGKSAFDGCRALKELTVPESVRIIGDKAFYGLSGVETMTFNASGLESVGRDIFSACGFTLKIGKNVAELPDRMFEISYTTVYSESATPPAISENTFYTQYTPAISSALYVPQGSLEGYKKAVGWKKFPTILEFDDTEKIFYNITSENTAEVISGPERYSGDLVIPSVAVIGGKEYTVTGIGNAAISYCPALTSVTIPNTVTKIGNEAFRNSEKLTEINIPESVASVGVSAFAYCTGLTSVSIPAGISEIANFTFIGCIGLQSVILPESVVSVGESAFEGCTALGTVYFPPVLNYAGAKAFDGTAWYNAHPDGILYLNNILLYKYKGDIPAGTYINIREGVRNISPYAFYKQANKFSVSLPASMTVIPASAFADCSGLTEVTVPEAVTGIERGAFSNCNNIEILRFNASRCSHMGSGYGSFSSCGRTLIIGETVKSLPGGAFNTTYTQAVYANSATPASIQENTFNSYSAMLYVPFGSKELYRSATGWKNFTNVEEVVVAIDGIYYNVMSEELLIVEVISGNNPYSGSVTVPSSVTYNKKEYSVTSIGNGAFKDCASLTEITLPEGIVTIGEESFRGCSGLKDISIPRSVKSIEDNAFTGCNSNCEFHIKALVPPSISDNTFTNSYGVPYIYYVPKESISEYRSAEPWGNFELYIEGAVFIKDGIRYNNYVDGEVEVLALPGGQVYHGEICLPETVTNNGEVYRVTRVAASSFLYGRITGIELPHSIEEIGVSAFAYNTQLSRITLPENLSRLRASAFLNCTGLTGIYIPESVAYIESGAFSRCDAIENINLRGSVPPRLEDNVFSSYGATLYVPKGSGDSYRTSPGWENFTNIVETDFLRIEQPETGDICNAVPYITDGRLVITGAGNNTAVAVYNAAGYVVYNGITEGMNFNSVTKGMYIIRVGSKSYKIFSR